jgi:hypothetical protein
MGNREPECVRFGHLFIRFDAPGQSASWGELPRVIVVQGSEIARIARHTRCTSARHMKTFIRIALVLAAFSTPALAGDAPAKDAAPAKADKKEAPKADPKAKPEAAKPEATKPEATKPEAKKTDAKDAKKAEEKPATKTEAPKTH